MKTLYRFGMALGLMLPALVHPVSGQSRVGGREFGHGFGSVVFPGGVPTEPRHPFSITDPGFAGRLGGITTGMRPYTGRLGRGSGFAQSRQVLVPYAYPVFVPGYPYYPDYQPAQPNVMVAPPQQSGPQVIINQNFSTPPPEPARPSVQVYQAPSPASAEAPAEATIYLIAFQDGSVRTAVACWIEGDTVHYVTPQGQPNKASVVLIDKEFSRKLNSQRGVDFRL